MLSLLSPSRDVVDFVDVISAGAGRSREEGRGTEVWLVFFLSSLLAGVYCLFVYCVILHSFQGLSVGLLFVQGK